MKKYLPYLLFLLGLTVLVAVYFLVIRGKKNISPEEEDGQSLQELSLSERPVTSLTPSSDGHWLTLKVEKITIDAASLDYELLYRLPDGRTQGVPGTIMLDGQKQIERDLLLGSESSGKFRYDEGVEEGTLTLRFRNSKGKLIAKLSTQFTLASGKNKLSSPDGRMTIDLNSTPKEAFFVVMETFGVPAKPSQDVLAGPYGVFSSTAKITGSVKIEGVPDVSQWVDGEWKKISNGTITFPAILLGLSQ